MRREPGFTAMEFVISIFIILTILAFAAPSILSMVATYNLHSAARAVATDMWNARLLAVNENTSFQINFTSGSYQIVRVSDNSVFKTENLTTDYNVGATTGSITFNSRGESSSGSVVLTNGHGSKTITVNLLGRASIS